MSRWRRKKREEDERENTERWAISYADFITLMFTFFAALYSLSSVDHGKLEKFSSSLNRAFQVIESPIPVPVDPEEQIIQSVRKFTDSVEELSLRTDSRGVVITLPGESLFAPGKAEIKASGYPLLDRIVSALNEVPGEVTIEGHTDNLPVKGGKFRDNWALSTARASAVLRYFIEKGLDPYRFSVAGYGEYRPIASNDTPLGRAKNRRVEVVIRRGW
ncbi:MAG: hypothetical protein D6713_06665 [Deltaproteobacteria bacterium]|nr:MAG: hypothetical protein D6713_06665 [Deltaproteobacteria bacterium]